MTLCRFRGAKFEETLASAIRMCCRAMIREFAQRMMDADVDAVACNAGYGEVSPDRVNSRNGYRRRSGSGPGRSSWRSRSSARGRTSGLPGALPRAERALASVVATSYLLGVSTRRVEKLAASLGVVGLSKSQVSVMAAELDEMADSFRNRPLDRGPYTFVWIDALTQKVREGGRTVNVHCLIATGVNADGGREILGVDVTSSEDGAGWLAFLRGLAARGLSGVALVISDDHAGLVNAIAAVLHPRRGVAALPDALPSQPAHPRAQDRPAVGVDPGPHHLRAARRRLRACPARPGRRRAGGRGNCRPPPRTWTTPARTSWPSPPSPRGLGGWSEQSAGAPQ